MSDEEINKKIDLELKKIEMNKKYGGVFGESKNLPPEVESAWLDQIDRFEQQYQKRETIKVWDFLGRPKCKKSDELSSKQLSEELERLVEVMHEKNLVLDTIAEVDDREIYRFITEELFDHEMDNLRVEGMTTHFIYEEFHPNAELDIKNAYDDFLRMTLGKKKDVSGEGYDFLYLDKDEFYTIEGKKIDKKQLVNKITIFLDSFDYFEVLSNEIQAFSINDEETEAQIVFTIDYNGCFNNDSSIVSFKGSGEFKLRPCEYGGWDIYYIDMPGLQI